MGTAFAILRTYWFWRSTDQKSKNLEIKMFESVYSNRIIVESHYQCCKVGIMIFLNSIGTFFPGARISER